MGTTYTAWDGNEYEWPPPKGWYQAIDNRWWAPDTGPMAMGEASTQVDATTQMSQGTEIVNPAAVRQENVSESNLPAWARPNSDLGSSGSATQTHTIGQPNNSSPQQTSSGSMLLGLMVIALALVVGVIIWLLVRGDDTATPATSTPTVSQTVQPTDPNATVAQTPGEVEIVWTEETQTEFETFLFENEIEIGDTDVRLQAQQICGQMNPATTFEEYETRANNIVASTEQGYRDNQTPLTERLSSVAQRQVIDSAVVIFCPAVATRLGVTLN